MNKLFARVFTIGLILTALFACKGPTPTPEPTTTITINVENGAQYASLIDEVEFYTDGTKSHTLCKVSFNNGKWVLPFPQTIADNYLETISEVEGGFPEGVTVSDPTAKVTMIGVKFYKNGKQVNYSLGHIYDNFPLNFGAPHFMYTNKPVVILGSSPDNGIGVPMIMDLKLKSGYNLLYYSYSYATTSDTQSIILKISTSTDKQYKWYISSYTNSPNM